MAFDPDSYISAKSEFNPDAYIEKSGSGVSPTQKPEEDPSLWERAKEAVTGAKRTTPEMESMQEIGAAPELNEMSMAAFKTAAGLLTSGDDESLKKVFKEQYGDRVSFDTDSAGNTIVNFPSGAWALNKPGLSGQDMTRTVAQMLGFSLAPVAGVGAKALGAAKIGKVAAASGATSAGIESTQSGLGGDFKIENVLLDTIAAGALEAVPEILRAYKARTGDAATQATKNAVDSEAARVGQTLSPEAQAAKQDVVAKTLVDTVEKTGKKQKAAIKDFAAEVAPDEKVLQSAKDLGVEGQLLPSHYSKNQTYIEIEQGLASIPGSKLSAQQKEATKQVAQKADDLITEFGGTTDKSALSENIKDQVLKSIGDLDKQADDIYKVVGDNIPKNAHVDVTNIRDALTATAKEVGGADKLEPLEKKILAMVGGGKSKINPVTQRRETVGPTYAAIDKERKKIGEALRNSMKPYKNATTGDLKRMYGLLTDAQEVAAKAHGMDDVWKAGKSIVQQRKTLEEQSINLLGKDLAGAIMPKVGLAVKKLSTGDYKAFDNIIGSIPPEHRQTVVMSALNDAFTMGSRQEKQLSAPGFADWMNGLNRNQAAKKRIYSNLPEGAGKRLDDLFNVANAMRNASKEKITTGRINALLDNFADADGMVSKLYQTGKKVGAAEGVTSSVGLTGAGTVGVIMDALSKRAKDPIVKAADDLLSSQQFQNAAKNYASSSVRSEQAREAAKRALLKSEKAQKWVSLLPSEAKREVARVGILSYLGSGE